MTEEEFYAWVDGLWRDDTSRPQEEWEKIREGIRRIHEVHYGDEDPIFPPGERIREKLRARGITQKNWLQHLDDMTDQEITIFIDAEVGPKELKKLNEQRKARPSITDRMRAEGMRDFGV